MAWYQVVDVTETHTDDDAATGEVPHSAHSQWLTPEGQQNKHY